MDILLEIKRAETPFYTRIRNVALAIIHFDLPFWCPWGVFLRAVRLSILSVIATFGKLMAIPCYGPIFKSYCVSCGRNLYLELVPSVSGHVKSLSQIMCTSLVL